MSGGVDIPASEIAGAQVQARSAARKSMGWRVLGTYVPKLVAAGTYATRGQRRRYQLWAVYTDDEVLVIDTTRRSPARIVIQHPDRVALAKRIVQVALTPRRRELSGDILSTDRTDRF
jgi:hypothetical protein